MLNHIPIHNHNSYAVACLINLVFGSFFIASHIHERWIKKSSLSLMDTNALTKGLIALFGFFIIPLQPCFIGSYSAQLIYLLLGLILGYLLIKFESQLITKLPNKTYFAFNQNSRDSLSIPSSYLSSALVALFEELLFSGFMIILCFSINNTLIGAFCVFLTIAMFSLSHLNLGYAHLITKFILGGICCLLFIISGNLILPVVTHMTFNLLAVKKQRELFYDL